MRLVRGHLLMAGVAIAAAGLALSPAIGAVAGLLDAPENARTVSLSQLGGIG